MKDHFSAPQWVDLVRGQLPEEVAADMDSHLRAGCPACASAFNAWQDLAAFAEEERTLTPPPDAVRVAKSYLAQRNLSRPAAAPDGPPVSWATATFASLVFDSSRAAASGVRAGAPFSRHLVFDARSLVVDLHVDTGSRTGWFLLSGQVADSSRPDRPLANVWLSLVDDHQEVSMFQTNEFGEFHCTFNRRRALKLMVYASKQVVAIPLESLFDAANDSPGSREQ